MANVVDLTRHAPAPARTIQSICPTNAEAHANVATSNLSKSARRRMRRRMLRNEHMITRLSAAVAHCLTDEEELSARASSDEAELGGWSTADNKDGEAMRSTDTGKSLVIAPHDCRQSTYSIDCESVQGLPCTWQLFDTLETQPSPLYAGRTQDSRLDLSDDILKETSDRLCYMVDTGILLYRHAKAWWPSDVFAR
jgi:hypothetical protein